MTQTVYAQTPNLPGSADPGRLEQRLLQPQPERSGEITPQDDLIIDKTIPEAADGFTLNGIELLGVYAFPHNRFNEIINEYVGLSVDLETLNHLAARITKLYRDEGYFISRAFVPEQEITYGIASIQIIEGFVSNVIIDDPEGLLDQDRLNIARKTIVKIKTLSPLHGPTLERYILLLNDTQGVSAQSILKAAENTEVLGAVDVVLRIGEKSSQTALSYNNYGSRFVGPHQISVSHVRGRNITAFEDLDIQASSSIPAREVQFGALQYQLPLNEEGLKASISLSYSNSEPGLTLKDLEVEGDSTTVDIGLSYPLIRSRRENFLIGTVFAVRNNATEFLDQELIDDKTRGFSIFAEYDGQDKWNGLNTFKTILTKGFDVLGATKTGSAHLSRQEGRSDFFKAEINATREQILYDDFQIIGSVAGQYAPHPLLSSQEFGYGGHVFGRAFDPSEITGDQGVAASLEARYINIPHIAAIDTTFVPFAFYDIGKVWNKDRNGVSESGASAGIGSYFYTGMHLSGSAQVAYPLTRSVNTPVMNGKNGPRILVGLNTHF